jgi:hypothetical protein
MMKIKKAPKGIKIPLEPSRKNLPEIPSHRTPRRVSPFSAVMKKKLYNISQAE